MGNPLRAGLNYVDRFLDILTSYRLVLYFLIVLAGWATLAGFLGELPYSGLQILVSSLWLVAVCFATNTILAKFLNVYKNFESDLITGLILALILTPASDLKGYAMLAAAGVGAMASKYILTFGKRHIFNPAALGAYLVGLIFHTYPSWWVGTTILIPMTVAGGLLVLRKMQRFMMVLVFEAIYIAVLVAKNIGESSGSELWHIIWIGLTATPLLFFGYVMLTEPLTSPRTTNKYLIYTVVVGILYSVTTLRFSPEEALLIGNVVAFALAPTRRLVMEFSRKKKEADGIYSFFFTANHRLAYQAGQYLEWTLPQRKADSRGNRRYLTLSSSPTEGEYAFAIKIPDGLVSSFKRAVVQLKDGDYMLAGALAGGFTLPKDTTKKLAFIAGGIGVTPYRSMIKSLVDKGESRDIHLFYSANLASQHAYKELFSKAAKNGLKTTYNATKETSKTAGVHNGPVDAALVKSSAKDWSERNYYISGPNSFVKFVEAELRSAGIKSSRIKTDYFPGYG